MKPESTDRIAQIIYLPLGEMPKGGGWHILTGNMHGNEWARVALRYEVEKDSK
jgi:hypothetical protein